MTTNDGISQNDHAETRALLVRVNLLAFAVPVGVLLLVALYCYVTGFRPSNRDMRVAALVLWGATMLVVAWSALGHRFGLLMSKRRKRPPGTRVHAWESRRSRRILRSIYVRGVGAPLVGLLLAALVLEALGIRLGHRQWMILIFCSWCAGLVWILYLARRTRHERSLVRIAEEATVLQLRRPDSKL